MKSLNNEKRYRIAVAKARRLQSEVFRLLCNEVVEASADNISEIHDNIAELYLLLTSLGDDIKVA